jgi:hypothetical protein
MQVLNNHRIGEHGFITVILGNLKNSQHILIVIKKRTKMAATPHEDPCMDFGHIFRTNAFLPQVLLFSTLNFKRRSADCLI